MTQFYSRNDVNYSGDVYSIPFKYIHKKEVKVYIDDELWTKWHFLNTNQLTLDEVPEGIGYNNIVSVRRETDIKEKVVTYDNNSLLNKENLNKSQDQLIYAVQEIYDNNVQFQSDIREEVDEKVERVSDAVEKLEFLEDSVEIANEAALEATEQAQIATEKAEETLNTFNEAMAEIDTLRQNSIEDIDQLVADHTNDLNSLDATIKKDADAIINRVGLNMFDTVVKDHVLTYEESKGLALQGTYVYKNAVAGSIYGYPDFYAQVVKEYNEAAGTETVNGVTVKVHSNGHKFYSIGYKTKIDEFFNSIGSAWFYGLDTENQRIFLPRDKYFAVNGVAPVVGNGMTLGLTNGTTDGALVSQTEHIQVYLGMMKPVASAYGQPVNNTASTRETSVGQWGVTTDPTKSGIEAHLESNQDKYLYICVGNTVADTSWVDVVTQVEGGVKDLEDKKNTSIAEIDANAKSYNNLTNRQITNCLLEVPQNIKLELNDGVLTLKAGSKVIVPNGFEADGTTPKFDYVTIESDKTFQGASGQTGSYIVSLQMANKSIGWHNGANAGSGTATTSTSGFYYRTDLNEIYYKNNTSTSKYCFPFCFVNISSGAITSIDQVFNGIGYIGSTIWVDKGVKCLIPNGRNEDGSLKNIEHTTPKVAIYANIHAWTGTHTLNITISTGNYLGGQDVNRFSENKELVGTITYSYNCEDNYWYYTKDGGTTWVKQYITILGTITETSTDKSVSDFRPKQPFRAVDYNDKEEIVSWGMPDYSAGVSFTSGKSFAQNGWLFIHCPQFVTATSTVKLNNILVYEKNDKDYNAGYHMVSNTSWIPYASNSVITTSGSFTSLIFYPAKGAK